MANLIVKIEGVEKLKGKINSLQGGQLRGALRGAMKISTNRVKTEARHLVPVDTGALRRSITDDVSFLGLGGVIGEVVALEKYAVGVEEGTAPHAVSAASLERWARKRGLNPFMVARAIAKKGTRAQPFMKPAFERTRMFVVGTFQQAIKVLMRA